MTTNPVLVGVDGSPESARAARLGAGIAQRAGRPCRLVLAVPDYGPTFSVPDGGINVQIVNDAALLAARRLVDLSLDGLVPEDLRRQLDVRLGRAPTVLADEAQRQEADVVILGGKRRRVIARLGGSTITHLVRLGTVPVLAVHENADTIRRVLVAVDLSWAAKPAIDAAERWARLFGAELRVLHVTEPLPVIPGFSLPDDDDAYFERTRSAAEAAIAPLVAAPKAEIVIRRGRAAAAIASEAAHWHADLVVLGSHGKGWADRLLIGSTSERLLHVLPASVLVVPVTHPAAVRPVRQVAAFAGA